MTKLSRSDIALLRAAASLAANAPERMHAAHLAPRLESLANRLASEVKAEAPNEETKLLRAA